MGHPLKAVVIGAGIIGLSCARSLQREGFDVVVMDDGAPDSQRCSWGNGGLIVPSHFVPLAAPGMVGLGLRYLRQLDGPFGFAWPLAPSWMWRFMRHCTPSHVDAAAPALFALNRASLDEYETLATELGEIGFAKKGVLVLCETRSSWEHEKAVLTRAHQLGAKAESVMPSDFGRFLPGAEVDAAGGVYFEDDAHLTPDLVQEKLNAALSKSGVQFRYGEQATGFALDGGTIRAVHTQHGSVEADLVVLAAGSWSSKLARGLGIRIPMLAGMGQGVTVTKPPHPIETPTILTEARVAITPISNGIRFGGTMELGGTERRSNPGRAERMLRSVSRFFPQFTRETFGDGPIWTGLRPCSPDGLPYIGRTRFAKNCLIATGHAMMGMSLGPITGRLIAEMAVGKPTHLDCSLFDPDRYA